MQMDYGMAEYSIMATQTIDCSGVLLLPLSLAGCWPNRSVGPVPFPVVGTPWSFVSPIALAFSQLQLQRTFAARCSRFLSVDPVSGSVTSVSSLSIRLGSERLWRLI